MRGSLSVGLLLLAVGALGAADRAPAPITILLRDGTAVAGVGPVERREGLVLFRLPGGQLVSLAEREVESVRDGAPDPERPSAPPPRQQPSAFSNADLPVPPAEPAAEAGSSFSNADLPAEPLDRPAALVGDQAFELPTPPEPPPGVEPAAPDEVAGGEVRIEDAVLDVEPASDERPLTPQERAEAWCTRNEVLESDRARLARERDQWYRFKICAQHGLRPTEPGCTPALLPRPTSTPTPSEKTYTERLAAAEAALAALGTEIEAHLGERPPGVDCPE
jgi:hypothetical protein